MTKTREQKEQSIQEIREMLSDSKGFMIVGFTGVSVEDINQFRGNLLEDGGQLRVVKRTLADIAFEKENIDLQLDQFMGQTGLIPFSSLPKVAGTVFDFAQTHEFEVLGGYDLEEDASIESDYLERIGNLPSREAMLGQMVGAISAPIRGLMSALKQRAEKVEEE